MYFDSSIILPVLPVIVKGFLQNDAKCLLSMFPPFRDWKPTETRSDAGVVQSNAAARLSKNVGFI